MTLSVCICTHDRAESLAETLLTVAHALHGVDDVEVVLVDNHPNDATATVARRFQRLLPLRYLVEPRQGLSHARNTAVRESRGAMVAFTDDDTLWSAGGFAALAAAAAAHPEAGFFGGRILPWWPTRRPRWLHDERLDFLAGALGHYSPDTRSRALGPGDPLPFGANFAVRRQLLDTVGAFDSELGAVGQRRRRGEETDLFERARREGFAGYYVADALCRHRVDEHNLSLPRLFELGVEKGLCLDAAGTALARRRNQALLAARGLAQVVRGRGDRFRQCVVLMGIEQGLLERRRE